MTTFEVETGLRVEDIEKKFSKEISKAWFDIPPVVTPSIVGDDRWVYMSNTVDDLGGEMDNSGVSKFLSRLNAVCEQGFIDGKLCPIVSIRLVSRRFFLGAYMHSKELNKDALNELFPGHFVDEGELGEHLS